MLPSRAQRKTADALLHSSSLFVDAPWFVIALLNVVKKLELSAGFAAHLHVESLKKG